jgi:hypothetical protein
MPSSHLEVAVDKVDGEPDQEGHHRPGDLDAGAILAKLDLDAGHPYHLLPSESLGSDLAAILRQKENHALGVAALRSGPAPGLHLPVVSGVPPPSATVNPILLSLEHVFLSTDKYTLSVTKTQDRFPLFSPQIPILALIQRNVRQPELQNSTANGEDISKGDKYDRRKTA